MHLGDRVFIEYWDGRDRVVEEFGLDEIVIGRRYQRQMGQEEKYA
jgi:hypothetical protein